MSKSHLRVLVIISGDGFSDKFHFIVHLLTEVEIKFGVHPARCRCLHMHHVTDANEEEEDDQEEEEDVEPLIGRNNINDDDVVRSTFV